jgi:1-acyl-sn-glycerol-3-phosphate acyltransferase
MSLAVIPFVKIDLPPAEQRPTESPVLWAPNHRSMFDAVVGLVGLHRLGYTASFLVNARYFESPLVGRLLAMIGAIPVGRGGEGRKALTVAADRLRDGVDVVIMAEGRLVRPESRCGGIGELMPGATMLAKRAGVPIVPTALIGTDAVWPIGGRTPRISLGRRHRIVVRLGTPIAVDGRSREALPQLTANLSSLVTQAETHHSLS